MIPWTGLIWLDSAKLADACALYRPRYHKDDGTILHPSYGHRLPTNATRAATATRSKHPA